MARILIGIGNPDRGDDAAGWEVAHRVSTWTTECRSGDALDAAMSWSEDDDVVMVDAMHSGAPAGAIVRIDARQFEVPRRGFASTHAFGPAEIVGLCRTLGTMPNSLVVYGIEAATVGIGDPMSAAVKESVDQVALELDHA